MRHKRPCVGKKKVDGERKRGSEGESRKTKKEIRRNRSTYIRREKKVSTIIEANLSECFCFASMWMAMSMVALYQ